MKISTTIITALMLAVLVVPSISMAQTQSVVSLQAEMQSLLAQVQTLEVQLAAAGESTSTWCYTFNSNLSIGMSGSGVTALQTALQKDGESVTTSGMFDDQTAAAVTAFQEEYQNNILAPYGLIDGTGYAGKATRAELNSLFGCTSANRVPPVVANPANPVPSPPGTSIAPTINIVTSAGETPSPGSSAFVIGTNLPTQSATIVIDPGSGLSQTVIPTSYNGGVSIGFILPSGILLGSHLIEVQSSGITSNQLIFMVVGLPAVTQVVSPGIIAPGSVAFVEGLNFDQNSLVFVDSVQVPTTLVSSQSLQFTVPSNDSFGSHSASVTERGGASSNPVRFMVSPAASQKIPAITSVTSAGETPSPGSSAFVIGTNLPTQSATIVIDPGSGLSQTVIPTSYNGGVSIGFILPSGILLGSHLIEVQSSGITSNQVTFTVVSARSQ